MSRCIRCECELTKDDIGAYKKFINRGSTEFMCKACLAAELHISVEKINEKVEQFKRMGCTLFI